MLRKLASNTAVGLTGMLAHKGVAFLTTLVLARGLGQDGFGTYSFVGVYMFFFGFLVDLGMERVVTRELAAAPDRIGHVLGNAILLKLALSAVVVPSAYLLAFALQLPVEVRYCILIAALALPCSIDLLFRSYYQSQYQVQLIYAVTLPSALLFLGCAVVCVHWSLPLHDLFAAGLLNALLMLGALLAIALPRVHLRFEPDRALLRMLLRDSGTFGVFVLLFMVAMRIDQLLLYKLRGAVEVGNYAVPVRITEALSILPEAVMMTVFPVLAASQHSAPERFGHTYRLAFKYLAAVILPIALVLTLGRVELVTMIFGAGYAASAVPMAILAWGMFFAYTGAVYLNLLVIGHQQRLLVWVSAIAVTVNIIANLLLIPPYGATGAALAMVIGNVVGFGCLVVYPQTAAMMRVCITEALRPLGAVAVASSAVVLVSVSPLAAAAGALALYVILMLVSGGVSWADVHLVRRLFGPEAAPSTSQLS